MPRVYERTIEVPPVDVLDWELIEDISILFENQLAEGDRGSGDYVSYQATDSRGEHREQSLDSFRASVEFGDGGEPTRVLLVVHRRRENLHLQVWWSNELFGSGSVFRSDNERDVLYAVDRCTDYFARAAERRKARESQAVVLAPGTTSPLPTSRVRSFVYNPWAVGTGTALVAAGIIAAIVALTH